MLVCPNATIPTLMPANVPDNQDEEFERLENLLAQLLAGVLAEVGEVLAHGKSVGVHGETVR